MFINICFILCFSCHTLSNTLTRAVIGVKVNSLIFVSTHGFTLFALQRMWRLMWRALCLTLWTLKDWALHTPMQTTVTPAWTNHGYDSNKTYGDSFKCVQKDGKTRKHSRTEEAGEWTVNVTVQLITYIFCCFYRT